MNRRIPPHPAPEAPSPTRSQMPTSDRIEFLMEAHDGISAKIVEQAGFDGIRAKHDLCVSISFMHDVSSHIFRVLDRLPHEAVDARALYGAGHRMDVDDAGGLPGTEQFP